MSNDERTESNMIQNVQYTADTLRGQTMGKFTTVRTRFIVTLLISFGTLAVLLPAAEPERVSGLPLDKARICVTGYDHNRPDDFPGLGDFIGRATEPSYFPSVSRVGSGH